MFTAITYERSKVIDKLCGGVVSDVCGTGKCFVIDRPARGDCPGKACGSYPFPLTEIFMYSRNIVRTVARGKLGTHEAPPADSNIHGLHQWLRTRRLPIDAYHFGLVDRLVQVIALDSVALGGEYHGSLPARAPEDVQDIKPVERVLDLIVIPGEVGDHHVESQPVADRALHCPLVLSDSHCGVCHGLTEKGFNDLSQRGRHQKTWPLLHPPAPSLIGNSSEVSGPLTATVAPRAWSASTRRGLIYPGRLARMTGGCGDRDRCLIPAASRSTTSAMRAARRSGRRLVASIQRR